MSASGEASLPLTVSNKPVTADQVALDLPILARLETNFPLHYIRNYFGLLINNNSISVARSFP